MGALTNLVISLQEQDIDLDTYDWNDFEAIV